jgi:predicted anti-sigma-YlaC factor YlaD
MEQLSPPCAIVRPLISAQMDSEVLDPREVEAVNSHLSSCQVCTAWMDTVSAQRRAQRISAVTVPDLTQPIVHALMDRFDDRALGTRTTPVPMIRVALAVVAGAMIAGATGTMLMANAHAPRELGGFELALGCGLLLAAWRPRHASTMSVVGCVAAAVLVLTAIGDTAGGATSGGLEANHFLDILGAFLIVALTRLDPSASSGPSFRAANAAGSAMLPSA